MIVPAIIAAAGALGASALGNASQNSANRTNVQLAQYQNNWQTAENDKAYARNLELWNMQNQYNSPSAQMARLRSAGLNPNLVYGSGVTGNSSGQASAYQPARISRAEMQPYRGWNLGLSDAVSTFLAARQNKAQINNLEASNRLIREQANTEGIRQANIAMQTSRAGFDYNLAQELRNVSIDRAIAEKNRAEADAAGTWTGANQKVLQYELDKALFNNRIKLSDNQYLQSLQALRKLVQDNDIDSFRYKIERITGKSDFATDMLRRLIMSLAPSDQVDKMFNPK